MAVCGSMAAQKLHKNFKGFVKTAVLANPLIIMLYVCSNGSDIFPHKSLHR